VSLERRAWPSRKPPRLARPLPCPELICSTGHKGKFGHEFMEFEFRPDGRLRYANNSNYKNDTMIRKEGECPCAPVPCRCLTLSRKATNSDAQMLRLLVHYGYAAVSWHTVHVAAQGQRLVRRVRHARLAGTLVAAA
jgi:hypothetical protein